MPDSENLSPARQDGRQADELRPIRFRNHIAPHRGGAFEFAAPDDPSSTAQIFTLTLSFSDADTDGVTVPPGTTGYLDLSS